MLFDLRGRGRRRTVQGIYLFLAILMGGGLVLFGVGGATSGGLVDAVIGSSKTTQTSDVHQKEIKRAQAQLKINPRNTDAWIKLARAEFQQASVLGYDQQTGAYSDKAQPGFKRAARAFERYLALDPKPVDDNLAALMVNVYGSLGDRQKTLQAQQIVVANRDPSAALYSQLSIMAYAAGNIRQSQIAEQRALELSPKNRRKLLKNQLMVQRQSVDRDNQQASEPQG